MRFDFILNEEPNGVKTIFSLAPKAKSWNIKKHYNDLIKKTMIDIINDECEYFSDLPNIIMEVIKTGETFDEPPFAFSSSEWKIEKIITTKGDIIRFEVFDSYGGNGFRFELDKVKSEKFCDFLDCMNSGI